MLSGDSLFVGDIARPDLAVERDEGAREIFRSLHERLLTLPDTCEVWPGHLGGSMCGGPGMDMKVSSTIGYERAHNALLREPDVERFVDALARHARPAAAELPGDRRAQPRPAAGRRRRGGAADAAPGGAEVQRGRARRRRAHRPAVRRGAHPGRGLHHGAERGLRHAAGVDRRPRAGDRARRPRRRRRAARRQARDGGGHPAAGGVPARRDDELARGGPRRRADRAPGDRGPVRPGRRAADRRRARAERVAMRAIFPGSIHVPYHDIDALPEGIDPALPVAAVCASGQRAAVAASLLARYGASRVVHVVGGGRRRRGSGRGTRSSGEVVAAALLPRSAAAWRGSACRRRERARSSRGPASVRGTTSLASATRVEQLRLDRRGRR